jgi:GNAT superfamily N-acetyltransferase
VKVRLAATTDARELARVHIATWKTAYRQIMPDQVLDQLCLDEFEATWTKSLARPERLNLVCETDDGIVGFASLGPSRDHDTYSVRTGEMYALYVEPDHWGQGAGHALWARTLDELKARGYQDVTLWVLEANTRARGFYEHVGFELEPGALKAIERYGVTIPEVRYRRTV